MSLNRKTIPCTVGSFIKKDLQHAYYLPVSPSSYTKEAYRFVNDSKYIVFDSPGPSLINLQMYSFKDLAVVGDEVPVLLHFKVPSCLTEHWEKWLTAFPKPTYKTVDEGLLDDVPIVAPGALQCIPDSKHSVAPDVLYKVHLKSSIPEIKVPCPRHMDETAVEFPCMVKVDQSWGGLGNRLATNKDELAAILKDLRGKHGWKGKILFQEVIENIRYVIGCHCYVDIQGEIFWIGTIRSGTITKYCWMDGKVDWGAQEHYKNLVWEQFAIPVAKYLHKQGYFGFVEFEVFISERGMYLSDLNPRISSSLAPLLLAPFMAEMGYIHSDSINVRNFNSPLSEVVQKADHINRANSGRVIILAGSNIDSGCQCKLSLFTATREDLQTMLNKLN